MLGLGRPRLQGRPSLLDLIVYGSGALEVLTRGSAQTISPPAVDDLPPLPASLSRSDISAFSSIETPPSHPHSPTLFKSKLAAMAPQKQRTRLEAAEDNYGSIFSVSGPVIVAENMIGCAMYELVSIFAMRLPSF